MQEYSLQLLRFLLDKKPVGFPGGIHQKTEDRYADLSGTRSRQEDVDKVLLDYGRESWAYRRAEEALREAVGSEKEDRFFLLFLPDVLKDKWGRFISEGGDIHNFRNGKAFEDYFTPEENTLIEEALIERDRIMHEYLDQVSRAEYANDFTTFLDQYRMEQKQIEKKIDELSAMIPEEGEKWDAELREEVLYFKRGFAEMEERPTVKKIQGKIDWYRGQMEAGNI
jgi:hypothetical protein